MMPIGLALDEGLANPGPKATVFFTERSPWWIMVRATGPTGHGSRFIKDTAVNKLMEVANKALEFRKKEEKRLGHDDCGCKHAQAKKLGDVTTLNMTVLQAGVGSPGKWNINVIPTEAICGFDVRISPTVSPKDFKDLLDEWTKDPAVSWSFAPGTAPFMDHKISGISARPDLGNGKPTPWWNVFESACNKNIS